MKPLIRIIARSLRDPAQGTPPDAWAALTEGGSVLVARTRSPFLDGARVLLGLGNDPDRLITMRIAGAAHDSFEPITLARAAEMAVSERDSSSVRFAQWRPFGKAADPATRGAELSASDPSDVSGAIPKLGATPELLSAPATVRERSIG